MPDDDAVEPDWELTDDELDQLVEEWAEVDREAASYLWDALREVGYPLFPGPALDRAVAVLRAGLTRGAWPFDYFVSALGGVDALPERDRDLWVEAAASTISPPEDPRIEPEELASVAALQHADWLGLVLGLVGRGIGTEPDEETAADDIDGLEDLDGEIEDRDGLVSVLGSALATLMPLWEALGILDDGRLTALGRWGLPTALGQVWDPPVVAQGAVDEELRDAVRALLADQPRGLEAVRAALGRGHGIVDADTLERALTADPDLWFLPDGTWGHLPTLTENLVLTYVVTARDLEVGALDDGADLPLFSYLADAGMPYRGGGIITVRSRSHGYVVPGPSPTAYVGPDGWLDGLEVGDVVGLRHSEGELALERVTFSEGGAEAEERAVGTLALVRAARAAAENAAQSDDEPDVWTAELVLMMRREDPAAFMRPMPPLGGVLEAAGLEVRGSFFGLPGTAWHGEPAWFTDEQRVTWTRWHAALTTIASGEVPARSELATLVESVDRSDLLDYLASGVEDSTLYDQLLPGLFDAASGRLVAVPLLLRARLAEVRGDGAGWLADVEAAVAADPGHLDAVAELADLRSITGDAREAERLYRLAELDPSADELVLVRRFVAPPTEGPGRNKPCPCGSGKKYKVCHGKQARHPLPDRAPWLWRKVLLTAQRPEGQEVLLSWGALLAGVEPHDHAAAIRASTDSTTQDLAVFEGGLLARFLVVAGGLLPADERELAERWRGSPLRLMEVQEVRPFRGLVVRDLLTDQTLELVDRTMTRSAQVQDVLFGRPLDDGAGLLRMQANPLLIPRMMRGPLLALLREGAAAEDVAAFLAPRGRPDLQTTDGQELLDCTARYEVDDLDDVWSALAEAYGADADAETIVVTGTGDVVQGNFERERGRVLVHTLAVERLRTLQRSLTELAPGARLVDEATVPFDSLEPPAGVVAPGPGLELDAQTMGELVRSFEDRWLADHIPALDGETPREAALGDRRRDLVALLDDFEWTQRRQPQPFDMDIGRLRRELGLS